MQTVLEDWKVWRLTINQDWVRCSLTLLECLVHQVRKVEQFFEVVRYLSRWSDLFLVRIILHTKMLEGNSSLYLYVSEYINFSLAFIAYE